MADLAKVHKVIEASIDPAQLRRIHVNARANGEAAVAEAAFRRLISLVPAARPGTLEHDFWAMVNAFEFILTEEAGKTTRLSRTRQKVARDGVPRTLSDWATAPAETEGFRMLMGRALPELTGEAIVLRHPEAFGAEVVAAARARLVANAVDLAALGLA